MADKDRDTWLRCQWDGDASTYADYVRKVRLAFEKTRKRRRCQLGPELVSQLSGKAWIVTQEIDHKLLTQPSGAIYLIRFLEERLARVPIPDAGTRAEDLLLRLKRPMGMSMSTWCHTVREAYRKLQRALKRARQTAPVTAPEAEPSLASEPEQPSFDSAPTVADPGPSPRVSPKASPKASGAAETLGAEEGDSPTLGDLRGKGKGKGFRRGREPSESSDEEPDMLNDMWDDLDQGLPEVLPTELVGWIMLRKSSLSAAQRLNVLSSIGNSLRAEDVERGLRGAEDELHLVEREREGRLKGSGKNKGKNRSSFWVEQDGEWGLLMTDDCDAEDMLEQNEIHWLQAPLHTVYHAHDSLASPSSPSSTSLSVGTGMDDYHEEGFWASDPQNPGAYLWWNMESDGEYYHVDAVGTYWSWSETSSFQDVLWSASAEETKQIQEAYAAYEDKIRTFADSRRASAAKSASRGFYPKGKFKGKSSGFGKKGGKGKQSNFHSSVPSSTPVMAVGGGKPGSPNYSGCFICGAMDHDFRSCPKRSRGGKGYGSAQSKVFMISGFNLEIEETYTCHPISHPEVHLPVMALSVIERPEESGFGVLDTGATETVSGLGALENIMHQRALAGMDLLNFEVVDCPRKTFKFGNGMSQRSESMVLLPQRLGDHLLSLGIFTLEADGVPVLVGIRTLSRLGALIDCSKSAIILSAIDPTLLVPLKISSSGHLLLDLTRDWLAEGSKIMFAAGPDDTTSGQYMAAAEPSACFMLQEGEGERLGEECPLQLSSASCSTLSPFAVQSILSAEEKHTCENLEEDQRVPFLSDVMAVRVHEHVTSLRSPSSPIQAQEDDMSLRLLALLAVAGAVPSAPLAHGFLQRTGKSCSLSTYDGQSFQQEGAQSQETLVREVRPKQNSASGPQRPKDTGSSLQWKPLGSRLLQGFSERGQRSRLLERLREVQIAPVLHTSFRCDRVEQSSRTDPSRYQPGCAGAGGTSCLSPKAEGSSHWLRGRGEVLDEPIGSNPCEKGRVSSSGSADASASSFQGKSTTTGSGDCGGGDGRLRNTSLAPIKEDPKSRAGGRVGGLGRKRLPAELVSCVKPSLTTSSYLHENVNLIKNDKARKYVKLTDEQEALKNELFATYEAVPEDRYGKQLSHFNSNDLEDDATWEDEINFFKFTEKEKAFLSEVTKDLTAEVDEVFASVGGIAEADQWDVLELCCSSDSMLTAQVLRAGGRGGRAGLFNQCDLSHPAGVENALQLLREHRPRWIWVSFPCGPTSAIQALNERTEAGKQKSKFRKRHVRKVLKGGLQVLREHLRMGGEIAWEWPRYNKGWTLPEVQQFWYELRLQDRSFEVLGDGCQLGLMATDGPVKKPWRFMSTHPEALQQLGKRCDGSHHHVPCLGTHAKRSAFYTPELCRLAVRGMLHSASFVGGTFEEMTPDKQILENLTPLELQKVTEAVQKLHRLCGHPNNRALVKLLKARGADDKTLAAASLLKCPECVESTTATPLIKVSMEKEDVLWKTMQMDSFYFRHAGQVHHFLLMLDEASSFGVVKEIKVHPDDQSENIATLEVIDTLEESWCQYFGFPSRIRCDAEGAFRGCDLWTWTRDRGIDLVHTPAEHHSTTGDVERAIGDLRLKMEKFLRNEPTEPRRAAHAMMQAHNHVDRVGGYAPSQWALGRSESAPESVPLLCSQGTPGHVMAENLRLRLEAESLHAKLSAEA